MKILLNALGIMLYFLLRYNNRTDKSKNFSGTFWLNDNWAETVAIVGFDLVFMLLFTFGGVTIDLNKYFPVLPDGIAFVGDLAISFAIGISVAAGFYELFKTKTKKG